MTDLRSELVCKKSYVCDPVTFYDMCAHSPGVPVINSGGEDFFKAKNTTKPIKFRGISKGIDRGTYTNTARIKYIIDTGGSVDVINATRGHLRAGDRLYIDVKKLQKWDNNLTPAHIPYVVLRTTTQHDELRNLIGGQQFEDAFMGHVIKGAMQNGYARVAVSIR